MALANDSHFAAGFAGVGTNFLLMCACGKQIYIFTIVISLNTIIFFFNSGFIWPTQGARYFVKYTNKYVPVTLAIEALRGITMRGWSINHTTVYMGFISMLIWALIFYVISYILYKLRKDSWRKM